MVTFKLSLYDDKVVGKRIIFWAFIKQSYLYIELFMAIKLLRNRNFMSIAMARLCTFTSGMKRINSEIEKYQN